MLLSEQGEYSPWSKKLWNSHVDLGDKSNLVVIELFNADLDILHVGDSPLSVGNHIPLTKYLHNVKHLQDQIAQYRLSNSTLRLG